MWGAWWIAPVLGLLFIIVMMMFCARMMRGTMRGPAMCGHAPRRAIDTDDLRREVHEPREEVRQVRGSS